MKFDQKLIDQVKEHHPTATRMVVTYSGSNDEGFIDQISLFSGKTRDTLAALGDELRNEIDDEVCGILSGLYGGWEINEGSHGSLEVHLNTGESELKHSEHRVSYHNSSRKF